MNRQPPGSTGNTGPSEPADTDPSPATTELVNRIEVDRIVILTDRNTDREVLWRVLEQAWAGLRDESPNRTKRDPVLKVVSDQRALTHLLLCAA